MKSAELKKRYIEFFKKKGHKEIPNASLIPEHDPSVLFTTAGMHPLVPFLLGQKHPQGKRLVNAQKCLRTQDIDEVGNPMHLSFFEMLGNWSLGDYWKKEATEYSYEFLTKILKIDPEKLYITCFAGDKDVPRDEETAKIWQSLGIPRERIYFLSKEENWWGPVGETGPCGPDTEMFVDTGKKSCSKNCRPGCPCGKYFEIWNDVFMQYNKTKVKAILIDAIHCLFDENRKINKELLDSLITYDMSLIIVTNANLEDKKNKPLTELINKFKEKIEIFTCFNNPSKKDSKYFEMLLKEYNLKPDEVIYFDHSTDNINSARKIGINSKLYKSPKQIKKFIEENLYYYQSLKQKNVDTGMGVERTVTILQGEKSVYEIKILKPIMDKIKELAKIKEPDEKQLRSMRIITDHIRASVFILGDENSVVPSNVDQGYILRRFIRRAMRYGRLLGMQNFIQEIAKIVIKINKDYPLKKKEKFILSELKKDEEKFRKTLEKGLNKFNRMAVDKKISGKEAFLLFQSYGFPIEMTKELAEEKNIEIDEKGFYLEYKKHQEISRVGAEKKFKGGLSDASYETTKLHTAAHLLLYALRKALNPDIVQKGSNITPERIRFDFNFDRKLTDDEIKKVEKIVNDKIKQEIEVVRKEMPVTEAKKIAKSPFEYKSKIVSVYIIDDCIEICMGPHVKNTKELGKFKITKQEAVAGGVRRIRAVLES
ncbi:MAG: HAD hydrolase-like protein [Candidatus Pacearchaeota archaeon]|nr:MAG: HAD hydrolase-like protein [Candidatus Pacearchaeota archaeon]